MQRGYNFGNMESSQDSLMSSEISEIQLEMEILRRKQMLLMREKELMKKTRLHNEYTSLEDGGNYQSHTSEFSRFYQNKRGAKRGNPTPVWQDCPMPPKRLMSNSPFNASSSSAQYPNPSISKMSRSKQRSANAAIVRSTPAQNTANTLSWLSNLSTIAPLLQPPRFINPPQSNMPLQTQSARKKSLRSAPKAPEPPNKEILYADKPPSRSMNGRMELALGNIIKELKEEYTLKGAKYESLFKSASFLYSIKQTLRRRLREVMLGKFVGTYTQIIGQYRLKYPKRTDKQLVNSAAETESIRVQKNLSVSLTEATESAEKYFNENFEKLLNVELATLFQKLQKLYEEENNVVKEDDSEKADKEDQPKTTNAVDQLDWINDVDQPDSINEMDQSAPTTKPNFGKLFASSFTGKKLAARIRQKLPQILPYYTDLIIKIINVGAMYQQTKATIIENTVTLLKKEQSCVNDETKIPNEETAITKSDEVVNKTDEAVNTKAVVDKSTPKVLPYYVKIIGQPALAKRSLMMPFLKKFKPKSIKKHTTADNLLFVGFDNEENYKNIQSSTGITIGNSMLTISAQKVDTQAPSTAIETKTTEQQEEKPVVEEDDDVQILENSSLNESRRIEITDDLENEISDLLNSIQNCSDSNTETDNAQEDKSVEKSTDSVQEDENVKKRIVQENGSVEKATDSENENDKKSAKVAEAATTDGEVNSNDNIEEDINTTVCISSEVSQSKIEEVSSELEL